MDRSSAPGLPVVALHGADGIVGRRQDPSPAALEFDVVFSSESIPVIHHNYLLDESDWVHERRVDDVEQPTLEAFLAVIPGSPRLIVDMKTAFVEPARAYGATISILRGAQALDRAVLVNWDHAAGLEAHKIDGQVKVGTAVRCLNTDVRQHVAATGSSYIYVDWEYLSAELVDAAHGEDVEVATQEGWHNLFYDRAVAWGVDIVLADDPHACERRLSDAQQRYPRS